VLGFFFELAQGGSTGHDELREIPLIKALIDAFKGTAVDAKKDKVAINMGEFFNHVPYKS